MKISPSVWTGDLMVAGDPAVDFVNTLSQAETDPIDRLGGPEALAEWTEVAGLASAKAASRMKEDIRQDPAAAAAIYGEASAFRSALQRIFAAAAKGRAAGPADLRQIDDWLRRGASSTVIRARAGAYERIFSADAAELSVALRRWAANAPGGARSVTIDDTEVLVNGCDPGPDKQRLRNVADSALTGPSVVSWLVGGMVHDGVDEAQARCAAVAGVAGVPFDELYDEGRDDERGHGPGFWITVMISELVLGILASMIVMWFSRQREFRADAGGANLAGRSNMIAALERLKQGSAAPLPDKMAAFGIFGMEGGGLKKLFMSHPPLDERIAALRAQG